MGDLEPTDEELLELEEELDFEDDEELEQFLREALDEPGQGEVDYLSLLGIEFDNPEELDDE